MCVDSVFADEKLIGDFSRLVSEEQKRQNLTFAPWKNIPGSAIFFSAIEINVRRFTMEANK